MNDIPHDHLERLWGEFLTNRLESESNEHKRNIMVGTYPFSEGVMRSYITAKGEQHEVVLTMANGKGKRTRYFKKRRIAKKWMRTHLSMLIFQLLKGCYPTSVSPQDNVGDTVEMNVTFAFNEAIPMEKNDEPHLQRITGFER